MPIVRERDNKLDKKKLLVRAGVVIVLLILFSIIFGIDTLLEILGLILLLVVSIILISILTMKEK
jgi:hypothetical protein